jgi:hypothetical protein
MADKSPRKPSAKKPGKTLKEKRTAKKAQAPERVGPVRYGGPRPSVTRPVGCWYEDPQHQPRLGWCPPSCNGPVTHSERAGNGDQHVYCEAHGHWRRETIRLPLVRRLRLGERPNPPTRLPRRPPGPHSPGGSLSPEMAHHALHRAARPPTTSTAEARPPTARVPPCPPTPS